MADLLKGVWEQKKYGDYTSSDSDTESEYEVSSIYGFDKSQVSSQPLTSNAAVAGNGKNGSETFGSNSNKVSAARKRNGEQRRPTRRPDPNVLNRNALLARENRRKKKLYLESVEGELHDARKANRALVKALKRQVKVSQRLEQEKRYFQNILANQSEISSLVTTLNKRRQVSIDQRSTSSLEVFTDSPMREPLTSCGSSSSYDPEPLQNPFGASSHDLDTDVTGSYSHSSWDDIWNTTAAQVRGEGDVAPQITTLGKCNNNSFDDHNYVVSPASQKNLDMPMLSSLPCTEASSTASSSWNDKDSVGEELQGVCLHLTRGKISLEFCPTCHLQSSSRDPPLQLFNDEMLA